MGSHDRKKMYYWFLQNKAEQEARPRVRRCSKCGAVISPPDLTILDSNGKIICKNCYDKRWEKIKENIKDLRKS